MIYNSFNDFLIAILKSSGFYEKELYERSSQKTNLLLTLFIASLVIVCLSLPILFPAVNSVNKTKDKVLTLFIEIPNMYIGDLAKRCEMFVVSLYDDQSEDMKSIDDGSQEGNNDIGISDSSSAGVTKRNIAKQPKNSSNTSKTFFFQFSIAVVLIIAYFSSMFTIAKTYISDIEIVTKEMSVAAYIEAHLSFVQNI